MSGSRYEFDYGRRTFDRVVGITLENGAPLDTLRTYKVAVNNFMAEGGDDYSVLRRGANRNETGLPVQLAEDPLSSVVLGAGKMLSDFNLLRRISLD